MKSFLKYILRFAFLAGVYGFAVLSCRREELQEPDTGEIVLWVRDDIDFVSETKATAITTLPSTLYWGATTGSSTESAKWATASASTSSSKIYTGKYQTASPTAYNYYLASQSFTVGGDMTVANNGTDIVAGRLAQSTSTVPSVTLNHIFARTGSLTLNVPSGYTASSVSWQIMGYSTINGTAGTFNMKSQTWTAASTKLSSYTAITGSSDMYLIPGTYTVKISFVLTKGNFSKSYTQTGNVTLAGGKVNNIVATTNSDEAVQVVFTTSVTAWTSKTLSFDLGDGGSGGGGGGGSSSEPTYSLSNYTCNGTSSTRINTNQRLFNTTDYPNGFRLEFDGTATVNSSSLSYGLGGWFGCMSEAGSPYPGFVVRQDRNYSNSLEWGAGTSSGDSSIPNSFITCYSGTNVTIVITYNRSTLTMTVNGTVTSCTGSITHDFPLCIGGTMNTTTTWFSDRYGYVQINSLKVYKL